MVWCINLKITIIWILEVSTKVEYIEM